MNKKGLAEVIFLIAIIVVFIIFFFVLPALVSNSPSCEDYKIILFWLDCSG